MSYAGYVLYDPTNPLEKYYFDKDEGNNIGTANANITTSRVQLNTFGKKPYVYYGGSTDYETIDLQGIFVKGLCNGDEINDLEARQQVDGLKAMIRKRKPLRLENSQGQSFTVDVSITSESTPRNHYNLGDGQNNLDYIEISISCVEID